MTSHTETQFNFINQINTTSTAYSCKQCKNQPAISCNQCKHRYCSQCISQLINKHLTLRNEIPKCPECLVTLNIQNISQRLLKWSYRLHHNAYRLHQKYKIKITLKEYNNMKKLINGYIRRQHYIIPNSLILLIFDFYHLNYVKSVKDQSEVVAPYTQKDCDQYMLVLDFNKICHRQKLCIKCNKFHLLDSIIFWPKCQHVLCITCLNTHAKDELMQNKIPECLVVDCHNDIAETVNEINGYNITFNLYNSLQQRLKLLWQTNDRFECYICHKWHKNDDMFTDKNKTCQHKYGNECYNYLMYETDCGHSDCLQCLAKCEICQILDENRYLMAWTKCGHKYHKHCAQKYINEWISKQQSILNILSNQYVSNNNMIPLCIDKHCVEFLDVHCAELLGATQYQCNILYGLRKKSILIDSKDIEIIHKYEEIDKQTLLNQDVSLISH